MANQVIETLLNRRSIRFYGQTPVEQEKIDQIIECASMSPSGHGKQSWHFTVLRNRTFMDEITAAHKAVMIATGNPATIEKAQDPGFDTFRTAPVAIIVSGDTSSPYYVQDCAISNMAMAVTAESLGLSSCYVVSYTELLKDPSGAPFLERLSIPEGYTPVCALCLGYKSADPKPRKPRKENVVNYVD